nr:sulfotransferase 1 [Vargula tsujii]
MAAYPFTIEDYSSDLDPSPKVILQPGNWVMPNGFRPVAEKIYNMEVREDDIWLLSWPKTGTTWISEMIWTLCHDSDTELAKTIPHFKRWAFPENDSMWADFSDYLRMQLSDGVPFPKEVVHQLESDSFEDADKMEGPRFVRSHLPICMLPPNLLDTCKCIYMLRNPMDTCVSFYHFMKTVADVEIDIGMYINQFVADEAYFSPLWAHVKEAWQKRSHPNMMFLYYEELQKDLPASIRKVSKFLNRPVTEEQVEKLTTHLHIDNMRQNPMINMDEMKATGRLRPDAMFLRKGVVGDWKNNLTPKMEMQLINWWNNNMRDCDIRFPGIQLKSRF